MAYTLGINNFSGNRNSVSVPELTKPVDLVNFGKTETITFGQVSDLVKKLRFRPNLKLTFDPVSNMAEMAKICHGQPLG